VLSSPVSASTMRAPVRNDAVLALISDLPWLRCAIGISRGALDPGGAAGRNVVLGAAH
jgi:hypothetical protein